MASAQSSFTLQHGGLTREYLLTTPVGWDGSTPLPLVLGLHGGGGTANGVATGPLGLLAETQGYLGVYPQGYEKSWNDGRSTTAANQAGVDDVDFFAELIDTVAANYAIDQERIYATGTSNGGTMSYRLAAELGATPNGYRLAGVAPTSANLPVALVNQIAPSSLMHLLIMVGTDDPLMPFEGGSTSGEGLGVLSSEATRDYWLNEFGLSHVTPTEIDYPDIDPSDESTASAEFYDTVAGPDLAYYVIDGGGHAPPGGNQFRANLLGLGPVNQDIDAQQQILAFFDSRPLIDAIAGDLNFDGTVDAADYTLWREGLGSSYESTDYDLWVANYGLPAATTSTTIPEPSALISSVVLLLACGHQRNFGTKPSRG